MTTTIFGLPEFRLNRDTFEVERHNRSGSIESAYVTQEVSDKLALIMDALDLHAVIARHQGELADHDTRHYDASQV